MKDEGGVLRMCGTSGSTLYSAPYSTLALGGNVIVVSTHGPDDLFPAVSQNPVPYLSFHEGKK